MLHTKFSLCQSVWELCVCGIRTQKFKWPVFVWVQSHICDRKDSKHLTQVIHTSHKSESSNICLVILDTIRKVFYVSFIEPTKDWQGVAETGKVWQGLAQSGREWQGVAESGTVWLRQSWTGRVFQGLTEINEEAYVMWVQSHIWDRKGSWSNIRHKWYTPPIEVNQAIFAWFTAFHVSSIIKVNAQEKFLCRKPICGPHIMFYIVDKL